MKNLILLPFLFIAISLSAQSNFDDGRTSVVNGQNILTLTTTDTYLANSFKNNYYIKNYQSHFDNAQQRTVYVFDFKRSEQIASLVFERINNYTRAVAVR